ncbi:MOSC domain-containing protein [Pseudonocardia acaciae]|uniref:MOSC domain-containing protein n=1 Tax=Pseudonocardia acaciae TaxID=551276 RepID=UPI00049107B0|nr:MOSC domain-containing protein [Pseudonocardia acaciae]
MTSERLTVAAIHRYPVKSMLGEALDECSITADGLPGDRAYAVVDAGDGMVASAKNPRKWGALLGFRAAYLAEPTPDGPLPPVRITFPDGAVRRSDDEDIDAALSATLGRDVKLVSQPPEGKSFEEVWPEIAGLAPEKFIAGTTVGHEATGEAVSRIPLGAMAPANTFQDLAVLHLITTATLAKLSALAPDAGFDPRRYRPNLVLDVPGERFVEEDWVNAELAVGGQATVSVVMPTMRCVMTTLAQDGLPEDRQTLRTIAKHNRREITGMGKWACAGVYASVNGPGVVRRGDEVRAPEAADAAG